MTTLQVDDIFTGTTLHHWSPSAISSLLNCPEQFRRDRILREPRFATAKTILGSAFHRAMDFNFRQKIESHQDVSFQEIDERAGAAVMEVYEEEAAKQEVRDFVPNEIERTVRDLTRMYHRELAPTVQPVAVERWTETELMIGKGLHAKLDLETDDGRIIDFKTKNKRAVQLDIDKDIQASAYLWIRTKEERPARSFDWHSVIKTKTPALQTLSTHRSPSALDAFELKAAYAQNTLDDFMQRYGPYEPWPEAAALGAWYCAPKECSYWSSCVWRGGSE